MPNMKTCFFGLLANTDSSILKVNLEHGFEIKEMPFDDGVNLIASLEKSSDKEVYIKLTKYSESKLFFISNSFESTTKIDDRGASFSPEIYKFANDEVYGYLKHSIQLMRLFREGNICMPLAYYFFMDYNTPQLVRSDGTNLYISSERYTLEDSEIPDLQRFILNTKLPFNESFLQLAFENFELSYQTHNQNMSFLSLMISLETLLSPSSSELRHRISRNTAVLLGKEKDESKSIFSDIKKLYDQRSEIVHSGKSDIIIREDLLKLRHYVRESIKEINKISKNKTELLDVLDSCGFGDTGRLKNRR